MIVKDHTNPEIERLKAKAHITGDCYLINGHLLESLESHNRTYGLNAKTIEEAEQQRLDLIAQAEEEARLRALEEEEELPEA